MIKFWKALVVCMVISLPLIYGYNIVKNKSWQLSMGVSTLGQMPPEINESSGLENGPQPGTFFTHNDRSHSGQPELFKIDKTGKLL
ncbi:MAG TPA: hypothetical protein VK927_07785, partial [Adhaeribacter sp.]|nr:hypothetical protein [Adhaeribacter sp.]